MSASTLISLSNVSIESFRQNGGFYRVQRFKLMAAPGLATDGMHVPGTFTGAGLASVFWLLLASRVWLL
ncbi:hypothetical protein D3C79_1037490 [compost metagenome]